MIPGPTRTTPTRPRDKGLPWLGLFWVVLVTVIWGVNWPVMKVALTEMSPWAFRALVVSPAGVVLLATAALGGLSLRVPRRHGRDLAVVAVFNITIFQTLTAFGIAHLGAGRTVLLTFTMPLWTTAFARLVLGEAVTPRRLAALALGLAGVAVLAWGGQALSPVGALLTLAAAASWGLGTVLTKRVRWQMPVMALTGWQLAVGGIPIAAVALTEDLSWVTSVSTSAWLATLYTLLPSMALCTYGWFKIVSLFPAVVSALCTLMIPVVGVVSSMLMVDEPVGWRELASLALISAAMALVLVVPAAGGFRRR